jgi:hypothetical protein
MYKCLLLKHIWKDQDKKQEGVVLLKSIIAPWWSELYGRQLSYEDLVKIYKEDGWKEYEEMFSSQKERNYAAN